MESHNNKKTHIALVSVPLYSHILSIIEFSHTLLHNKNNFHFTCIIPTLPSPVGNSTNTLLNSLIPSSPIHFILLNPLHNHNHNHDYDDHNHVYDNHPARLVELAISRSLPSIYEELNKLMDATWMPPLTAVIVDALVDEVTEFVKDNLTDVLSYVFFPSTAMMLSLCLHSSELDAMVSTEYKDHHEPIQIPGCIPIHGIDLPDALQDRTSKTYQSFLEAGKRFHSADGILINTFKELEPGPIQALHEATTQKTKSPLVYPIGPIISRKAQSETNGPQCLTWLDKKPPQSVLYVSFGSGGTLSHEQLNQLALGLELSGQNFLWVFKPPSKFGNLADFGVENEEKEEDPLNFLPLGFLNRTKDRGLVVLFWAPQVEVLSHGSIGGFVCHCGWNSVLESVVHGVPLIVWPLFAEQRLNAVMLCDDDGLKVGLKVKPKVEDGGIVEKEEIARVVTKLMDFGDEEVGGIRRRMSVLKDAARKAIEEHGSSAKMLSQFGLKCKSLTRD